MNNHWQKLAPESRQYALITMNYWAFTITDGALRMLVVLHFYTLGYSAFEIAGLFVFYELFSALTNLLGGWLGARVGLNKTMQMGLAIQIIALSMLLVPSEYLTLLWVMLAQSLSGVAKDLNKMSAKSAIKFLVSDNQKSKLFYWVALLTGSKNTLKGVGFFVGGILLSVFGFKVAVLSMIGLLGVTFIFSALKLKENLGKSKHKVKFTQLFSHEAKVNYLAAARLFLFASRDVWFVVALPITFSQVYGWNHWQTSGFFAFWVIIYGVIQGLTPKLINNEQSLSGRNSGFWIACLVVLSLLLGLSVKVSQYNLIVLIVGLFGFSVLFAINSSLHSFLIVDYAQRNSVSMDVGFYYMANAMGRLVGTLLSGVLYQWRGLDACFWVASSMLFIAMLISFLLPEDKIECKA